MIRKCTGNENRVDIAVRTYDVYNICIDRLIILFSSENCFLDFKLKLLACSQYLTKKTNLAKKVTPQL